MIPRTYRVSPLSERLNDVVYQAAALSKSPRGSSRIASHSGFENDARPGSRSTCTSAAGSRTGSSRRIRPLTIEKIAVLAPIPSASDKSATSASVGCRRQ